MTNVNTLKLANFKNPKIFISKNSIFRLKMGFEGMSHRWVIGEWMTHHRINNLCTYDISIFLLFYISCLFSDFSRIWTWTVKTFRLWPVDLPKTDRKKILPKSIYRKHIFLRKWVSLRKITKIRFFKNKRILQFRIK